MSDGLKTLPCFLSILNDFELRRRHDREQFIALRKRVEWGPSLLRCLGLRITALSLWWWLLLVLGLLLLVVLMLLLLLRWWLLLMELRLLLLLVATGLVRVVLLLRLLRMRRSRSLLRMWIA
jgi:hypothetical protein